MGVSAASRSRQPLARSVAAAACVAGHPSPPAGSALQGRQPRPPPTLLPDSCMPVSPTPPGADQSSQHLPHPCSLAGKVNQSPTLFPDSCMPVRSSRLMCSSQPCGTPGTAQRWMGVGSSARRYRCRGTCADGVGWAASAERQQLGWDGRHTGGRAPAGMTAGERQQERRARNALAAKEAHQPKLGGPRRRRVRLQLEQAGACCGRGSYHNGGPGGAALEQARGSSKRQQLHRRCRRQRRGCWHTPADLLVGRLMRPPMVSRPDPAVRGREAAVQLGFERAVQLATPTSALIARWWCWERELQPRWRQERSSSPHVAARLAWGRQRRLAVCEHCLIAALIGLCCFTSPEGPDSRCPAS